MNPKPRSFHVGDFIRFLPEPARALRWARLLVPGAIVLGLFAEPALRWLLRMLGAGA